MKAAQCDECAHYDANAPRVCALGHRPRFYMPSRRTVWDQRWGHKRTCQDFTAAPEPAQEDVSCG